MLKRWRMPGLLFTILLLNLPLFAQEIPTTSLNKVLLFPDKLSRSLAEQNQRYASKLDKQTEKYFKKLFRQEQRLKRKVMAKDSILAVGIQLANDSLFNSYKILAEDDSLLLTIAPVCYSGKIDSMITAIKFLEIQNISSLIPSNIKHQNLLEQYGQLNKQLTKAEYLKNIINARKDFLREKLLDINLGRSFTKYQKQVHYYKQQVNEYKQAIENPAVIEQKVLELLSNLPEFRKYFDKYSQLGTMFRLPGQMEEMDPSTLLIGLQNRQSVINELNNRFGGGSNASVAVAEGLRQGQDHLATIKSKLKNSLSNNDSPELPGFIPNQQKSKSILKRLDLGTNFQSTRANNYFPITSDLGLSLGYKLSDRSIIGIGASYKIGWGNGIRNIKITNEGVGLRSFLDIKVKGGFWLTGGAEWNYRSQFETFSILKSYDQWQQSMLLGVQKKYRIGKRGGTASMLYDFLWHCQPQPRAQQPILFRLGYNFNTH